jgi:hypothetical protein
VSAVCAQMEAEETKFAKTAAAPSALEGDAKILAMNNVVKKPPALTPANKVREVHSMLVAVLLILILLSC